PCQTLSCLNGKRNSPGTAQHIQPRRKSLKPGEILYRVGTSTTLDCQIYRPDCRRRQGSGATVSPDWRRIEPRAALQCSQFRTLASEPITPGVYRSQMAYKRCTEGSGCREISWPAWQRHDCCVA